MSNVFQADVKVAKKMIRVLLKMSGVAYLIYIATLKIVLANRK
jgi:hypothetical protein